MAKGQIIIQRKDIGKEVIEVEYLNKWDLLAKAQKHWDKHCGDTSKIVVAYKVIDKDNKRIR